MKKNLLSIVVTSFNEERTISSILEKVSENVPSWRVSVNDDSFELLKK